MQKKPVTFAGTPDWIPTPQKIPFTYIVKYTILEA